MSGEMPELCFTDERVSSQKQALIKPVVLLCACTEASFVKGNHTQKLDEACFVSHQISLLILGKLTQKSDLWGHERMVWSLKTRGPVQVMEQGHSGWDVTSSLMVAALSDQCVQIDSGWISCLLRRGYYQLSHRPCASVGDLRHYWDSGARLICCLLGRCYNWLSNRSWASVGDLRHCSHSGTWWISCSLGTKTKLATSPGLQQVTGGIARMGLLFIRLVLQPTKPQA